VTLRWLCVDVTSMMLQQLLMFMVACIKSGLCKDGSDPAKSLQLRCRWPAHINTCAATDAAMPMYAHASRSSNQLFNYRMQHRVNLLLRLVC
jgi:hypothetical protein